MHHWLEARQTDVFVKYSLVKLLHMQTCISVNKVNADHRVLYEKVCSQLVSSVNDHFDDLSIVLQSFSNWLLFFFIFLLNLFLPWTINKMYKIKKKRMDSPIEQIWIYPELITINIIYHSNFSICRFISCGVSTRGRVLDNIVTLWPLFVIIKPIKLN